MHGHFPCSLDGKILDKEQS